MHELSIVYSIVQTVSAALEADAASHIPQRVRCVHLQIGALAGVTIDALFFSYDLATDGTALSGSRLEIEQLPIKIFCPSCAAIRTLDGVQCFRCPVCNTPSGDIRQGRELDIISIELEAELETDAIAPAPEPATESRHR